MIITDTQLAQAVSTLRSFTGLDLTATLASLENGVKDRMGVDIPDFLTLHKIDANVLSAAAALKLLAGQINVAIHAAGILMSLPHVLEDGEAVEYVSLGAGNTGRNFDLETNKRVAEFKFIRWCGGAETIRQNALFKDMFQMAETNTSKRKVMYVLGTHYPLKFLTGGRAMSSILSRNIKLEKTFRARYGDRYPKVRDWYQDHGHKVEIADMSAWLPELTTASIEYDHE